ncbi:MAG: alpha/beta hydrolase [Spirosomataceae bacterium]
MKKRVIATVCGVVLVGVVVLLVQLLVPRRYHGHTLSPRATTRYWDLSNGSRLAYTHLEAKGVKQPIPIIYLHGGPGGHITDRDIETFSALSEIGFEVYLYDQLGGGRSMRSEELGDYTMARHLADLHEIIGQIHTTKVILIGQSWGSILAAHFVAKYPDKVAKIVFTSPGPLFPIRQELATLHPPDSLPLRNPIFSNAQGNQKAHNLRTKAMAFLATHFGLKLASDQEADDFMAYLSYEVNKSTVCDTANIRPEEAGNGFYASVMTLKSLEAIHDPRPTLKVLNTPVLVIKGQCDNQKWGYTSEYLALFKNSRLAFIPNAGHFIAVEQREAYLNILREFLVGLP